MITPPKAKKDNMTFIEFGHIRTDPYHWLNHRDSPQVLAYLAAENTYTDQKMAGAKQLEQTLFEEFKTRIKENDNSVPYKKGDYYYYVRYEKDKNYPIYCRKKDSLENPETIILDVNILAQGKTFYQVGNLKVSTNAALLAYAEDTLGRRNYTIRVKNLTTGEHLPDKIVGTSGNMEWANDNQHLFYTRKDPETLRPYQLYRHQLKSPENSDQLIFEEKDDTFDLALGKTKSKRYLVLVSDKSNTSEVRIAEADNPNSPFRIFTPRQDGREYDIDHHQDNFIIRTNDGAPNFKLMECGLDNTHFDQWKPLIPYDPTVYTEDVQVFNDYLAVQERKAGLIYLTVYRFASDNNAQSINPKQARLSKVIKDKTIDFNEPDYVASMIETPEMSSHELRYSFSSLKFPEAIFDYNMQTHTPVLKKQDEILGGFKTENYTTQRIFAHAPDGTAIPISLVYRTDRFKKGTNPLLITGYGAYGISSDPDFNPLVISLLDRGFVYAIAHIRGGSELGREWYLNGKLLHKKNTFNDFIACTEYCKEQGFGDPKQLYAMGGSAGGLLIGAVINQRPDLFHGVIADVPFVDLMNTMMDPNIPLTAGEYSEWGNPHEKTYYDYMLSYSPYDNIARTAYPNMLVTTGYHDSQVQYWEPAKWVARLRATKTDDHLLLLRTTMDAGHGGASGRYNSYREFAFEYAFLLSLSK